MLSLESLGVGLRVRNATPLFKLILITQIGYQTRLVFGGARRDRHGSPEQTEKNWVGSPGQLQEEPDRRSRTDWRKFGRLPRSDERPVPFLFEVVRPLVMGDDLNGKSRPNFHPQWEATWMWLKQGEWCWYPHSDSTQFENGGIYPAVWGTEIRGFGTCQGPNRSLTNHVMALRSLSTSHDSHDMFFWHIIKYILLLAFSYII